MSKGWIGWLMVGGVVLVIAFLLAPMAGGEEVQVPSGSIKAKDFELLDLDSQKVKLSDYKGKVVVLNFWATWCPPCVKEIPHIDEVYKAHKDKGLVVLGLSVDQGGPGVVRNFTAKTPIHYRLAMATREVFNTYQEYLPEELRGGIPFTFVIDRQGFIRTYFVGYRDKATFEKVVKPLLAEQPKS